MYELIWRCGGVCQTLFVKVGVTDGAQNRFVRLRQPIDALDCLQAKLGFNSHLRRVIICLFCYRNTLKSLPGTGTWYYIFRRVCYCFLRDKITGMNSFLFRFCAKPDPPGLRDRATGASILQNPHVSLLRFLLSRGEKTGITQFGSFFFLF